MNSPHSKRGIPASLALGAAILSAAVIGGSIASATNTPAVVYDAIPSTLPANVASLGVQATATAQFGDDVHLAGTERALRTIKVTMSDWALYSDYSSDSRYSGDSVNWSYPITLSIYSSHLGANGAPDTLLGSKTQTVTIPWRPAADPGTGSNQCGPGSTRWYDPATQTCNNGKAFNVVFDLGSSNIVLPDNVIVGVAFNTQTYGASPVGTPGPYNSLNVGIAANQTVNVGSDDSADRVFWNTSRGATYADGGAAGVGIFRQDSGWTPNGTVNMQITAASATPSDVYVNPLWSGVPAGQDPDGSGPASQMGYDAFSTVQAGINGVSRTDGTVHVAAGTTNETGHMVVSGYSNLTIAGAGQGSTIINTNVACPGCGSASHTYGVLIEASHHTTLQDLTIIGPNAANSGGGATSGTSRQIHGTGYGIHDDDGDRDVFTNVTVRDSARSNFDFNGANGVTLTNVTATGAGYGNGVNLTDTNNVTINGISTSGNAWGGIALYATGTFYPCGVNSVSVAGANLGELDALYTGIDAVSGNGSQCVVTGLSVDSTELPFKVTVNQGATGDPREIYVKSFADATNAVSQLSPPSTSQPVVTATADGSLSSTASLTSLSLSDGSLSPAFDPATLAYTANVANSTTSVHVNASANAGASSLVSGSSNLAVGRSTVQVRVTSADGSQTKTYTIAVTRAAPPAATTTTTTTTSAPPATVAVKQPEHNAPAVVAVQPTQSGVATVTVAPPAAGTSTPAPPPVAIDVSWTAGTPVASGTFTVPVTVTVTPQPALAAPTTGATTPPPVAGGFAIGNTVVQIVATNDAGQAVTALQAPMKIHIDAAPGGNVPAYSHDGTTWTTIPRLSSPELPSGQSDGYYVNTDGSVDIYTLHLTFFGLLKDTQAPSTPKLRVIIQGHKLYLHILGAKDNVRVTGYRLRYGSVAKNTPRSYLVVTAHAGRIQVLAVDAAGNRSKAATVTVVATHSQKEPFKLKG